jgi:uncharacterized membrane protein YjjB (DUF3815 family)
MSWSILYAAPVALGFAVLLNARRRALLPITVLAVLAKGLSDLAEAQGLNIVVASFLGALLVGCVAYTLGPATDEASPVYAVAPIIPLVPGGYIFEAMQPLESIVVASARGLEALTPLTVAATNGMTAAAILLALAIGATSPVLFLPRFRSEED